jgi:hypothetical protein
MSTRPSLQRPHCANGTASGIARQGSVEIICHYKRPFVRLCSLLYSLLCLFQCNLPLLSGVVLCLGLRKDSVGNLEVAMRCAVVACCIPFTWKLLRWGFADRANEGHESLIWFIHPLQHNHVVANLLGPLVAALRILGPLVAALRTGLSNRQGEVNTWRTNGHQNAHQLPNTGEGRVGSAWMKVLILSDQTTSRRTDWE